MVNLPRPVGWTHIVMNYIGPSDGEGIRIFDNGTEVANVATKVAGSDHPGDGRIVVGRIYTDRGLLYASVQVDELTFFNKALSTTEIAATYNGV